MDYLNNDKNYNDLLLFHVIKILIVYTMFFVFKRAMTTKMGLHSYVLSFSLV